MALSNQIHESHEMETIEQDDGLVLKIPVKVCVQCQYCKCHYMDVLVRPCRPVKKES